MTLNKRERTIFITTLTVLGLLGVYQFFVDPLLVRRGDLAGQIAATDDKVRQNEDLVDRSKRAAAQWREMVSGGLRKDASEAESIVTNNLREWAQEAGMSLTGLTPARPEKEKDFYRITIRATGTGRMSEIARFLHKIQNASIPVRISEMQISNRGKEGTDDLGIQMAISTVYLAPESEKRASAAVPREAL